LRRRTFLNLSGGILLIGPVRPALAASTPVVGFLGSGSPASYAPFVAAFRQGLNEMGYVEGKNVSIEFRWAGSRFDRLPALAADLVEHKVDVIATSGGTPSARAAKGATSTIPIVFSSVADPVGADLVASLDRSGNNLTGLFDNSSKVTSKRLDLMLELMPEAKVIALLANPKNAANEPMVRGVQETASAKGVQLKILNAVSDEEIAADFDELAQSSIKALVIASDPFFSSRRDQLVALAASHSVPAIYSSTPYASSLLRAGSSAMGQSFRRHTES
jgi:ABC-type uncharacterized transport system substrate-binding protein